MKKQLLTLGLGLFTFGLSVAQTNNKCATMPVYEAHSQNPVAKANFVNADGKLINKAIDGILASDAFFPFADNIEIAYKYGISVIIAPSGSIKDEEVKSACDIHKIALSFIGTRHFKH